jgi:hypothetical protein
MSLFLLHIYTRVHQIAVHCAEVDNVEDTASILSFKPDRLGHALLLSK